MTKGCSALSNVVHVGRHRIDACLKAGDQVLTTHSGLKEARNRGNNHIGTFTIQLGSIPLPECGHVKIASSAASFGEIQGQGWA